MPHKHAPKGRIKARDPLELTDPLKVTCTAKSKRSGKQCQKPPIPGGTVCHMHGGGAPQVRAKAMDRLMALQHPAIDRLMELVNQQEYPSTAYAAVKDVLDRTMGKPVESLELTGAQGGPVEHVFRWKA